MNLDIYKMPVDVPEELRQPLGFLRQWLNEDRITEARKIVSNEELWHWLKPAFFPKEKVHAKDCDLVTKACGVYHEPGTPCLAIKCTC